MVVLFVDSRHLIGGIWREIVIMSDFKILSFPNCCLLLMLMEHSAWILSSKIIIIHMMRETECHVEHLVNYLHTLSLHVHWIHLCESFRQNELLILFRSIFMMFLPCPSPEWKVIQSYKIELFKKVLSILE